VFVELLEYRRFVAREAVRRLAVILTEADAADLDQLRKKAAEVQA